VNTLANQIFTTYSDFDRYLQKFRMVKVSGPTLKRILSASRKEEIAEAGKSAGASVPESFMLAKMGEITLANAIEFLMLMGRYGNFFDFSNVNDVGKSAITLAHDLGPNGSLFLASYVESIFKALGRSVKIDQYPDGITIELQDRNIVQ
jgi:hypothetical protein